MTVSDPLVQAHNHELPAQSTYAVLQYAHFVSNAVQYLDIQNATTIK